jgi:hypothetical protein
LGSPVSAGKGMAGGDIISKGDVLLDSEADTIVGGDTMCTSPCTQEVGVCGSSRAVELAAVLAQREASKERYIANYRSLQDWSRAFALAVGEKKGETRRHDSKLR